MSACTIVYLTSGALELRAADTAALPVITAHPQSQTVTPGSTATFSVTATSPTPVSYQWRFNGGDIPEATNSTFPATNARKENAGYYVVLIRNSAGAVASLPAFLSLEYTNGGTVNLANLGAGVNAPITDGNGQRLSGPYSVELVAGPEPDQMKPTGPVNVGFIIGIFNAGARPISTVQAGETTYAQVRVWDNRGGAITTFEQAQANGVGRIASNTILVTTGGGTNPPSPLVGLYFYSLQGPFWLSVQPTNQTVVSGSTVTLEAQVFTNAVPVRFQWRKDGAPVAGATNTILRLTQVSLIDAANYSLVVSIENQRDFMVSSIASLSVCAPTGGTVSFANAGPGINAPSRDRSGNLLNGTNWFVELLAGPVPSGLLPVQEPFRPSFMNGYFNAGIVAIPTLAPNDFGVAQIRFWDATKASSFAEAQAAGAEWNQSVLLPIYTGELTGPPGHLWPTCPLSPSPPALRADRLASTSELVLLRIGCPGSFQVETSTDLLNWLPLVTIANPDMVSEFQVPLSSSGSRFYRASW